MALPAIRVPEIAGARAADRYKRQSSEAGPMPDLLDCEALKMKRSRARPYVIREHRRRLLLLLLRLA
jgi:hypothetical protein